MKKRFFVCSNAPQGTLAIEVETATKPSEHFAEYKEDITTLYRERNSDVF
ncbi:hypothetical protein EZS27_030829 [termite gut metagenome]|uniref:Uncharacterized protein n=1 Tax=termite gut metagenome TaxID=433724 RepID=A0A5J4QBW6_9ZZZZ